MYVLYLKKTPTAAESSTVCMLFWRWGWCPRSPVAHTAKAVCANACKLRSMQAGTCVHMLWLNVSMASLVFVVGKKSSGLQTEAQGPW